MGGANHRTGGKGEGGRGGGGTNGRGGGGKPMNKVYQLTRKSGK